LVEKESKYRYIQASIGTTGYEVSGRQRQEIDQNIAQTEKRLGQLEKDIVRKMGELMNQGSSESDELVKEYTRVKNMV
jgi:sugar-specific transcriptional regulator TrmB